MLSNPVFFAYAIPSNHSHPTSTSECFFRIHLEAECMTPKCPKRKYVTLQTILHAYAILLYTKSYQVIFLTFIRYPQSHSTHVGPVGRQLLVLKRLKVAWSDQTHWWNRNNGRKTSMVRPSEFSIQEWGGYWMPLLTNWTLHQFGGYKTQNCDRYHN